MLILYKEYFHKVFLTIGLLWMPLTQTKSIGIIAPWIGSALSTDLKTFNRNNGNAPFFALRKALQQQGDRLFEVRSADDIMQADLLLWFDLSQQVLPLLKMRLPQDQILFIWEPPIVSPHSYDQNLHKQFRAVYTWNDELITQNATSHYKKCYYPRLQKPLAGFPRFAEKKLLCMMYNNLKHFGPGELKRERVKAIHFFQKNHPQQFDLYGKYWPKHEFPSLQGAPTDKPSTLKNYKFFICYENTGNLDGYITEKIFDCFHARCVPVYLGAPNVTSYIPQPCFIDARQFRDEHTALIDYNAMLKHLESITEFEYQNYLDAAEQYCKSPEAQLYSIEHFVSTLLQEL